MYQSLVTLLTQLVSSIQLQVHIRKNVSNRVRNTSQLLSGGGTGRIKSNKMAGGTTYFVMDCMIGWVRGCLVRSFFSQPPHLGEKGGDWWGG